MSKQETRKENLFTNLLFNIVVPSVILSKFCTPETLGPVRGLIVALMFPVGYGLYELIVQKKKNFISLLGFFSTLLTGVIGIWEFPLEWIAIKEAMIPFIIGVVVLISTWTPFPLVEKLIYNRELLNVDQIDNILTSVDKKTDFSKILKRASILLAGSFFLSSFLNFVVAKVLIKSNPGTTAFAEEMGTMTWVSYPVIVVPSMICILLIFWYLFSSIKKLTNLTSKEIFAERMQG